MKRVTQGGDISFNISSVRGLGDTYTIKFYTTNADNFIMKTNGDVVDGIIALNWSELETLGNGVVNYTVDDNTIDTEYSDGTYNRTFSGTTDFYIDNPVSEESDIDILTARLNSEIKRSITKDDELSTAIDDETTARVNADNDLSERINDNSTAIANTYTKQEVNDLLEEKDIELPDNIVVDSNYVHTDNNFTDSEKNKLNGIENGANVNVQSDWKNTDSSSDAYIKNKPTKVSEFTNDAGYLKSYTETDPVFTASAAHGIKSSDISNWNSKTSNIGTITGIEMNGQTKGTSGIVNLGDVVTAETDPTVPAWAKAETKPSYTANEVGALPNTTVIPSKTSDLTNDSNFIDATNNANVINATSIKIFDGIDSYVVVSAEYDDSLSCNTLKFTDLFSGASALFSLAPMGYALNLGTQKRVISSLPTPVSGVSTVELVPGYTFLPASLWRYAVTVDFVLDSNYNAFLGELTPEYYIYLPKPSTSVLRTVDFTFNETVYWKDGTAPDIVSDIKADNDLYHIIKLTHIDALTVIGEVIKYK